jgi:hypothetical protein
VQPSVWTSKAVAQEIATTLVDDGTVRWIEVTDTQEAAEGLG